MAKMRVVQVAEPNGPLTLVERPVPEPGTRQVRIKVQACGVCRSGVFAVPAPSRACPTPSCPATRSPA
jgi:alcohol dehydrogenase/propanol-preferring alcohol dehydrogenase